MMAPRIIGADEAHGMLEGTTEGPWQFHAPEGESSAWVTQARDRDGVPLAILDGVIEANGRLMAASWELAHSVIAQAEEIARLRAVIEGRTTPPTYEEIAAHADAGGAWLVTIPAVRSVRHAAETRYTSDPKEVSRLWWSEGARWVAVRDGRPCAWPIVDTQKGGAR